MEKIHGFTLEEIFEQASMSKLGVSFDQFSLAPMSTLHSVGQGDAIDIMRSGFRPLLPAQVKLRRTLEDQWVKDGCPVEHRVRRKTDVQRTADKSVPMVLAA